MKKRIIYFFSIICLLVLNCWAEKKKPTHADVRYSEEYDRSKLDIWLAESDTPTPLVINFHGGGFRHGDKGSFQRNLILRDYLPQGISFASVNYPFVEQVQGNYLKILEHCAGSVEFLKKHASKYNLDTDFFSIMGNSAGALIACYLGHAKQLGIKSIFPIQQPKGTPLLMPFFREDGPSVMVYNRSNKNDKIHHPDFAIMVRERCKNLNVDCNAYGVEGTGLDQLPKNKKLHDLAMEFFQNSWGHPKREKK